MASRRFIHLVLMAAAFMLASAQPSDTTCGQPDFSRINATGTTSFPGFHPNGSVPGFQDSNWTLHTGMVDVVPDVSLNTSFIYQNWWLTTDPVINTPAAEFPFNDCAFLLTFQDYQARTPATGPNTCKNIFNDECQSAIIDMVNSYITASGDPASGDLCANIMNNIIAPAQCKDSMFGFVEVSGKTISPEPLPFRNQVAD